MHTSSVSKSSTPRFNPPQVLKSPHIGAISIVWALLTLMSSFCFFPFRIKGVNSTVKEVYPPLC